MIRNLRSLLIVVPRRIGDVLLATPVVKSLRKAFPQAHIAALVFAGTEEVLAANADLDEVLVVPMRPSRKWHVQFFAHNLKRFDVGLALLPGDRPTIYASLFSKHSVGLLPTTSKHWWKRLLLNAWLPFDPLHTHTVVSYLKAVSLLHVEAHTNIVVSWSTDDQKAVERLKSVVGGNRSGYAVLHPWPKFAYKRWHSAGWIELFEWFQARGLHVFLTGSSEPDELESVSALARQMGASSGITNLAGQLSLSKLGYLLQGASIYVGPDTSITHMAAALGTRTVALYGPTNPVTWGPWPPGQSLDSLSPWVMRGTQRINNVVLLQGEAHCVPCMKEGCERHINSLSDCIQKLPALRVIRAIEMLMNEAPNQWIEVELAAPPA